MLSELSRKDRQLVNNDYYDTLGEAWSSGEEDAVELLKAEGRLKNRWVRDVLRERGFSGNILDVGCGGGFLTNELARDGFDVTGLDQSVGSLEHARRQDTTGRARYIEGNAYVLPFGNESFDAVTCFDFLEHVSEPMRVLSEIVRVLRPGGAFFYHTFDRNPLAWLIAIKGVEWFVRGAPKHLHAYALFVPSRGLRQAMRREGLVLVEERGLRPSLDRSFWKLLTTGRVDSDFSFRWTANKMISYAGLALKPR